MLHLPAAIHVVGIVEVVRHFYRVSRFNLHIVILLVMVEGVEVEIGHQFGLHVSHRLRQCIQKLIEVLFVEEHFVTVISIVVKSLFTFRNGNEIVARPCRPYIEKVRSPLTGLNAFAVQTLIATIAPVVRIILIVVRHFTKFFEKKPLQI
jgi:hypothetical protein